MFARIREQIQEYTGLPLDETTLSLLSEGDACFDTSLVEECGFFVPRELAGFVRQGHPSETARRAIHEASHGLYLENTTQGQAIVDGDRDVAGCEQEVFGRLLGRGERVLAVTDMGKRGMVPIEALDEADKGILAGRVPNLGVYCYVAFCGREAFLYYRTVRKAYSELVEQDLETQEGFCVLVEEAVLRRMGNPLAARVLTRNLESDDVYGRGFRKLNVVEESHGLESVLDYIKGVILCTGQRR